MCVRTGLRQDWRGLALLTLITTLMGAVTLAALAGARRTDTAVPQFLQYAGPFQGQISANPATFGKIAALPGVAYTETGALMLAVPVAIDGRPVTANTGEVITQAVVHRPPQARAIVLAGRDAVQSRANEVLLNESAAQALHAHVGSVLEMRGYRPSELQQVMNGVKLPQDVSLGSVVVTGIIRLPTDLTDNAAADADVSYTGQGDVIATAAFYQKYAASVGHFIGMSFQLKQGAAGMSAFVAQVKHLAGNDAQIELGDDNAAAGAFAQRGTTLEALALLVFAIIVALALLVVVGQSLVRQTYAAAGDFPALRSLGATPRQLAAAAAAPGALVAAAGMALAIPVAYLLSWFTPLGLARRAEISPGFEFDAAALLGGAAVLALLLAGRAALAAPRAVRTGARTAAADGRRAGLAGRLAARGLSPAAVSGIQLAFEPGRGRSAVPVRAAIAGMAAALAAVLAALVFGSSVSHVIGDPAVAGWDWDVTVGNPHSGDISAQAVPRLRADTFVSGFTVTAMGDALLDGRDDVTLVGLQTVTGRVVPPVLAGRLPTVPGEIALGGRELRALGKSVGDTVVASGPHGRVPLRVTGEVVLSPEITNEQTQLGSGAVMTMQGATAVSGSPMPRNVFLVSLRNHGGPASPAAITSLKQQFPGTVLPAVPPPEVRDLSGVSGLPLILAFVLMLLACGIIAHTLLTSVRRRRRDLAILKTVGFVTSQVRATVAWQATALACAGLIIGVPLGLLAGRWAWILFASQVAIVPAPVISPLTLLAIPVVLLVANAIAAIPARSAARTQAAVILRTE
ncbi:MAG TPA: FtsX-like permease family protein [Trebonia sp.]|nr:FtsX-like permease family protein [Trebonia sp.]